MHFGGLEIVLIMVVILLIFGANRLPDFITGIAKGIRGFKKEIKE